MENTFEISQGNPVAGLACVTLAVFTSIFAWIKLQDYQVVAAIVASTAATLSAVMGAIYFYFAIREKKISIKKLSQ